MAQYVLYYIKNEEQVTFEEKKTGSFVLLTTHEVQSTTQIEVACKTQQKLLSLNTENNHKLASFAEI